MVFRAGPGQLRRPRGFLLNAIFQTLKGPPRIHGVAFALAQRKGFSGCLSNVQHKACRQRICWCRNALRSPSCCNLELRSHGSNLGSNPGSPVLSVRLVAKLNATGYDLLPPLDGSLTPCISSSLKVFSYCSSPAPTALRRFYCWQAVPPSAGHKPNPFPKTSLQTTAGAKHCHLGRIDRSTIKPSSTTM
jgi:hypothetical protein